MCLTTSNDAGLKKSSQQQWHHGGRSAKAWRSADGPGSGVLTRRNTAAEEASALVKRPSGVDGAAYGAASFDLGHHVGAPGQPPMLRHRKALVVCYGEAAAIVRGRRIAGEALLPGAHETEMTRTHPLSKEPATAL